MTSIGSDNDRTAKTVRLSGRKLDRAIRAIESPDFLKRLTIRIVKLAAKKGFISPFEADVHLPGGLSAADLALVIVEKSLVGRYSWDDEKFPCFERFCLSRAESVLSNWLDRHRRVTTVSPLVEEDEGGETAETHVTRAADSHDIYSFLRSKDGHQLGDQLMEDFALSLDNELDQSIVMAIHDDRSCIRRDYCIGKLGLSEGEFDAAMKRVRRAAKKFFPGWCKDKRISLMDKLEIR